MINKSINVQNRIKVSVFSFLFLTFYLTAPYLNSKRQLFQGNHKMIALVFARLMKVGANL